MYKLSKICQLLGHRWRKVKVHGEVNWITMTHEISKCKRCGKVK